MRRPKQIAMAVTVCLGIAVATHVFRAQRLRAASTSFAEYTITMAETSKSRNPTPLQRLVFEAQRADGSKAGGELAVGESGRPESRHVWLVPERLRAKVNDALRAKTTLYLKDSASPSPPAPDPQCGFSRLVPASRPSLKGQGEVLGYRTVVIQTEHEIGGQTYLNTEWRAPDLGCAVLRVTEDRRDIEGAITGHFETQVLKITVGSPDPRLFEIPEDYAEKSPSQMHDLLAARFGKSGRPMPQKMRERLEREDREYFKNRQAAGLN